MKNMRWRNSRSWWSLKQQKKYLLLCWILKEEISVLIEVDCTNFPHNESCCKHDWADQNKRKYNEKEISTPRKLKSEACWQPSFAIIKEISWSLWKTRFSLPFVTLLWSLQHPAVHVCFRCFQLGVSVAGSSRL